MQINTSDYNYSLLKIARIELAKRADKIATLECELASAKAGNDILLLCVFILAIYSIFK